MTGFALTCALVGCGSAAAPSDSQAQLAVEVVVTGLESPVFLTAPPGDGRLFVVEQPGRIRIVKDGRLLAQPFLDIQPVVRSGGERGLLSVAFHPRYAENGYFYVDYTDQDGNTQVVRYSVLAGSPDVADPSSARTILSVDQPFSNHNGGLVAFGPDGMLYVGMGDGGSGGDPMGNGQNLNTLLGKLLRIDVDGGDPYAVPTDNPFAGERGMRGEIWAFGLRNPWRYSFDPPSGLLYIADVGQNEWEEIDVSPAASAARNYGWNTMEGRHCYASSSCDQRGLTMPVLEYSHADGCSIIGGYVYRGSAIPDLVGDYFYSDWCSGWLRSFRYEGGQVSDRRAWDVGDLGSIVSFGLDDARELYVLSQSGMVYRLVASQ